MNITSKSSAFLNGTPKSEADALENRYAKLVDLKYERGLTNSEDKEFAALFAQLSSRDASFYEPILKNVRQSAAKKAASTR